MKKLIILFMVSALAVGCSKSNDNNPINPLLGKWRALTMEILYQNEDGSSYRDEVITDDVILDDPKFTLIMKEETLIIRNDDGHEDEYDYSHKNKSIEFTIDNRVRKVNYVLTGNELVLTNTEKDEQVHDDVVVDKMIIKIKLEKINGMQPQ